MASVVWVCAPRRESVDDEFSTDIPTAVLATTLIYQMAKRLSSILRPRLSQLLPLALMQLAGLLMGQLSYLLMLMGL